jgi:cell division protein FtsA
MQSIKSKVVREFDCYTKITQDIINGMVEENDNSFNTPQGYRRVEAISQEYKLDGKPDKNPVGAPTRHIEGNYLNIIVKEQFLDQLNDCFRQAEIDIEDSFCAARMDADIILPADARRNGCALVNIGADTTTIVIYKNDMMRKLVVVPLGSNNITMDLCSLQISKDEAEEIKITHGYKPANGDICSVDSDTVNNVIGARMNEILQNVKYQIEESNENVVHIIFTGGGSKLKNFELLLDEYIPNYRCNIVSEPKFSLISSNDVNLNGIFSTALYSLLKLGSVNCCEELKPATYTPPVEQKLEFLENDEPQEEIKEEPQKPKEENKKEESAPKNTSTKKPSKWSKLIDTVKNTVTQGTLDFIGQITEDDDADNNNNN